MTILIFKFKKKYFVLFKELHACTSHSVLYSKSLVAALLNFIPSLTKKTEQRGTETSTVSFKSDIRVRSRWTGTLAEIKPV